MIRDLGVLHAVRREWESVRFSQQVVTTNLAVPLFFGGVVDPRFQNLCHSLLLPFACSVPETVLQQLRDEGAFQCGRNQLRNLMDASRSAVPWVDHGLVNEARERRNDFAHEQKVQTIADCTRFVDAIERELIAWGVLTGPVKPTYMIGIM